MNLPSGVSPLSQAIPGRLLRVKYLAGDDAACKRLREIGFCEQAEVRLLSRGGQMICSVRGTRLALSLRLAEHIWVEPFAAGSSQQSTEPLTT